MAAAGAGKPAGETAPGGRQSNTQRAYSELKRRILDNEMAAGYQALEQELAELLGMSRTPVREALIRLANEGMVEVRPRHGMRVLPISARDMREIYDVLTSLESTAAELVARNGVSQERLETLNRALRDMDDALATDDMHAWARADERFHELLVEYCGNERLRAMVRTCWDQAHRVRMATLRMRPKPLDSTKEHAQVVDTIARQDADAARRIHRNHRVRAGRMLIEILNTHGIHQL